MLGLRFVVAYVVQTLSLPPPGARCSHPLLLYCCTTAHVCQCGRRNCKVQRYRDIRAERRLLSLCSPSRASRGGEGAETYPVCVTIWGLVAAQTGAHPPFAASALQSTSRDTSHHHTPHHHLALPLEPIIMVLQVWLIAQVRASAVRSIP